MKRIEWELMKPEDIEIRPACTTKEGKTTLLLYQNSRNTMDALDRNFGNFGWKIEYKDVAGQIYGRLSILNTETGEWISKEDTGEESNISAQKGQSSDILKRCAVRFGYGRELYTAPRILVDDDGYGCSGYRVGKIAYNDNREIIQLTIVNRFGKEMFTYPKTQVQPSPYSGTEGKSNLEVLSEWCKTRLNEEPSEKNKLVEFFNYYKPKINEWKRPFNPEEYYSRFEMRT